MGCDGLLRGRQPGPRQGTRPTSGTEDCTWTVYPDLLTTRIPPLPGKGPDMEDGKTYGKTVSGEEKHVAKWVVADGVVLHHLPYRVRARTWRMAKHMAKR